MKKALIILSLALFFTGCNWFSANNSANQETTKKPISSELKNYTNEELGYSITYPNNWVMNIPENSLSKLIEVFPKGSPSAVNYVTIGVDLRQIEEISKVYLSNKDLKVKETKITFTNQKAYEYTYESQPNIREIYIPYQDKVYFISTAKNDLPLVQEIFQSFKFTK